MWVYLHTDTTYDDEGAVHRTYTVGFFDPDGRWYADDDFLTREAARMRIHYLNGGAL